MRLIVAGGRDFEDRQLIEKTLLDSFSFDDEITVGKPKITEFVVGKASGADTIAEEIAIDWKINYKEFPADWDRYGNSAGTIRNEEMKLYGQYLLAFWDGISTGTKDMINRAEKVMPVKVVRYERRTYVKELIDIIFDWETLDTKPTSVVASLGVIPFNRNKDCTFEELVSNGKRFKFDLPSQYSSRTFTQDTVDFWKLPENKEAFDKIIAVTGEEIMLESFPEELQIFLDQSGYNIDDNVGGYIWNRGNAFDSPILDNIYQHLNAQVPFPYWMLRDIRTAIDSYMELVDPAHEGYGYINNFPDPDGFIKHLELHDCARDILQMRAAKNMAVWGRTK